MRAFFQAAMANVARYGDTDILPNPVENRVMAEYSERMTKLLLVAHKYFNRCFTQHPPDDVRVLAPVSHTGFRWSTQIDPFWNVYSLGLTLAISERIEKARIPVSEQYVFSYRIDLDAYLSGTFFQPVGWKEFMARSRELSDQSEYVVMCDIADCYSHISHHRIENALIQIGCPPDIKFAILEYLKHHSHMRSSGVPVGGPAARILVELVLNFSDHLLKDSGIQFCRFADDYHIFCSSVDDAYAKILMLSSVLDPEGLSLQKSKTRILPTSEFRSHDDLLRADAPADGEGLGRDAALLMSLSLRFDPYSPTAQEDYERLTEELARIDIIGLLNEELAKSRIHISITRRIVQAVRHLEAEERFGAIMTMLRNAEALFPIFSQVCLVAAAVFDDLGDTEQESVCALLRDMIRDKSYVFSLELHLAYAVRVLGKRGSQENMRCLTELYDNSGSTVIKRDIILVFGNWSNFAWLSLKREAFQHLSGWERRAFVLASYSMKDAGSHWRRYMRTRLDPFERLVRDWFASRLDASSKIPL